MTVVTLSASTRGQLLPFGQVTFVPPALSLLLSGQYAAAANCSKNLIFSKVSMSITTYNERQSG